MAWYLTTATIAEFDLRANRSNSIHNPPRRVLGSDDGRDIRRCAGTIRPHYRVGRRPSLMAPVRSVIAVHDTRQH
jgi:hypothetical protein